MKRRILCFVLTMAMVLSMLVVIPATTVSAADDELYIETLAEFKAFRDAVNSGTDFSGKTVYLEADIDLSGESWTPIGNATGNPFKGTFDGQGYIISGLIQSRSSKLTSGTAGLFGYVSSTDGGKTTIKNFKLTSSGNGIYTSSGGAEDVGTVVSQVRGSTTGVVTVNITGVWSTVNLDCSGAAAKGIGGILGDMGWVTDALETIVNIDSCRYSGTLNSPSAGSNDYGGIVGWSRENNSPKSFYISNCLFDGTIVLWSTSPDDNGGIIGYLKGNTNDSKLICHVENCIVAGQFQHPNKSGQTVTGYIVSEQSGNNTDYVFTNVYYCNDSDRHTGGAMGGWYGYMKGGSTVPSSFTATNVTAKTMTELKAMDPDSGDIFADDTKWYFGESDELPVPYMIYENIILNEPEPEPSIFDDLSQDTFTITTADELMEFASIVNAGTSQFQGKTVYLGADINLTGYTWQSIGKTRSNGTTTFRGTFDGQGHTISNMTSKPGNNPDGAGGLFGYVVYSATIQNFRLTGSITATASGSNGDGYIGSIIGCAFQTTATINLSNIWSSVNITMTNSGSKGLAIGGLVGQLRAGDNMGTLTMNIDSCVYDGSISDGNRFDCVGGFIGRTHENRTGRPLYLTITNSVFAGSIHVNDIYSEDISCLIGYIKGNHTGNGAVNVTVENVLSTGRIFFYTGDSRNWDPVSNCVGGILSSEISGTVPVITVTNLYYKNFQVPVGAANAADWQDTALYLREPTCTINVEATDGKMTSNELLALTTSAFSDASKWTKPADTTDGKYYPCPKSIYDYFGAPSSFYVENTDIYIGTAEALNALATAVNGGKDYAGKTIHITDDITIASGWTSIGITSGKPFLGNFNGHGHTIEIHQTLSNPDGVGGLIGFVRTPASGTSTIENLHVTGRIDATNSNSGSGYFGGLIATVDGNTSGSGGTVNITNVWNSLYINAGFNNMWTGVGGFVGFCRHADGLKSLTVNFDSCVWDGTLNVGPAAYHFGGYVGYTGNNKAGRTLTINITNSVAAGTIALNINWDQYAGLLVGFAKGDYSDAETAKVTVNVNNVISNGKMTFAKNAPGSDSIIGHVGRISGTTEVNMTNLYYNAFDRGNLGTPAPALGNGTANTSVNVEAKSEAEQYALTTNNFSDSTKWNKQTGYIICPAGISGTFGEIPNSLKVNVWDVQDEIPIETTAEFLAFRDAVNNGKTMAGKTFTLTKDIDLAGEAWVSIGVPGSTKAVNAKSFCGTFDGDGHTISNMTTNLEPTSGFVDMQGGLFSSLGDGAVVKNFTLTGTYRIHNISTAAGTTDYFGSVANAVKGTVLIQNVHSSVDITTSVSKNSNNAWPGAVERVAGIVGFIYHDCSANLTIDGCTYSGTINTGNQAIDFAGIMAHTGTNSNGSTKVVTIQNCAFTGRMTLNQNESYAMQGVAGIISHVAGNATVTITNTHSAGKIYFNGSKNWPVVDSDNNPVKMGQILGYNEDGTTVNIDDTVTYIAAKLNKTAGDDNTKYILPEAGRLNGDYAADTAAKEGGSEASFEARNINDIYKGIRFKATFYTTQSCTGGGTTNANFGIYLMTKETYDKLGGESVSKGQLDANKTLVVQVKATKFTNNNSNYVVSAVVYNLNTATRQATKLVAIPYAGEVLGTAATTSYNEVFN